LTVGASAKIVCAYLAHLEMFHFHQSSFVLQELTRLRKAQHFITLSELIECLKDQGLVIDNEEEAKKLLVTLRYYKNINGYGF